MTEYSVLERIPYNGQKVMCFGHATWCCKEDMDENAEWHETVFHLCVSSYRIKKQMPDDIEGSVLEQCEFQELWEIEGDGQPQHVIGVTKWRNI